MTEWRKHTLTSSQQHISSETDRGHRSRHTTESEGVSGSGEGRRGEKKERRERERERSLVPLASCEGIKTPLSGRSKNPRKDIYFKKRRKRKKKGKRREGEGVVA